MGFTVHRGFESLSLRYPVSRSSKGQVVIPKAVRDRANLQHGDEVEFELRDDESC
ncbi:MAG: AbrB/MazE/SpoVT family DNA-binding domain-containing protein [Solirubrobacteraceae bacterium]